MISIVISHYLEAEIDYKSFILFCRVMSQDYAHDIWTNIEGVTVIFVMLPITTILV